MKHTKYLSLLLALALVLGLLSACGSTAEPSAPAAEASELAVESAAEAPAEQEETSQEAAPAEEPAPEELADEPSEPEPPSEEERPVTGEPAEEASEEPAEETYIPAADGAELPDSLYLVQEQRGWCTLASAAMMLRARMFLSGNDSWSSVTQTGIYSSAWLPGAGLYFNWTYRTGGNSITVSHQTISGGISVSSLKALLDKHPEGIVLYVYDVPHAILVTDYVGDTFYGSDPANAAGKGRKPIADTWLGSQCGGTQSGILGKADAYWYVSSYSIQSTVWYTVTFDAAGGYCAVGSRSVKGGSSVGELPTATRSGFYFDGWFTEPYMGSRVNDNSSVTGNITLYAHWYAVSGSIDFSQSPATINFSKGTDSVSVTVTGTGYLNGVTLDFALEDAASGKLRAEWDDDGGGTSRTVTFRADPSSSGTYHATFYMRDAETGLLLNQRSLTVNVINREPYLELDGADLVFAANPLAWGQVDITYGGTDGDLPEGYRVECENDHPEAISATLGAFNGSGRKLDVRIVSTYKLPTGRQSLSASLTLRLLDPYGGICSEMTVSVSILPTEGSDGDDGNIRWAVDGTTLRISIIDPASDEGGNMWNYETVYGRAPWYHWADVIRHVEIESGVTSIGACAFYGCTALETVSIPDTVTRIGDRAFAGCSSLYSVEVPGSVVSIAEDVFRGCSSLEELRLNEGTVSLAYGALDGCSSLRSMYVPESMTDLQMSAGTALQDIYYNGTQAKWSALDDACSITDKLPKDTVIHTTTPLTVSGAAEILFYASASAADPGSEDTSGFYDALYAAQILQLIAGLAN